MELDGVDKRDYWSVVDHCYLCDMCFMTKCPYVPPHEWNVDFPHLMLRGKAVKHRQGKDKLRDKVLSSTDLVGSLAGIPVVAQTVNAVNRSPMMRAGLEKALGVDRDALLPEYQAKPLRRRLAHLKSGDEHGQPTESTRGRAVLFSTCYGNYNDPAIGEDLVAVFRHNDIPVRLTPRERCCGMPKLELGDLEAVEQAKKHNVPMLAELVDQGWDIVAPIPSCVLMFRQELPLMFPDDPLVGKVRDAIFDPYEYLMLRHRGGKLRTDFKASLGKVAYHVACHQRVQNIGLKTRDVLTLVPDTKVVAIERCSGHDGTYAVKKEFHAVSMKIVKPVVKRVKDAEPDHYTSDCAMAGRHIQNGLDDGSRTENPMTLLRRAYGI
jgi:Fe-S oxidoreductase